MKEAYPLVQAVRLPRGTVEAVVPSLVHQGKVYAYEVVVTLSKGLALRLDARQLPLEVPALAGQSGEMLIYLTEFGDLDLEPIGAAHTLGRYLGPNSAWFSFPTC